KGFSDQLGLGGGACAHGMDEWQGGLPLGEVIANILTERGGIAGVVEGIVHQLECHTDVAAVSLQGGPDFRGSTGQHGGNFAGGGKENGGLFIDNVQVVRFADIGFSSVDQLLHLTFGDDIGGIRQDGHDIHAADGNHHLKGAGIEKIADEDAGSVAPVGIGCGTAAAQFGHVHDVIVEESRGVDKFNDRRQVQMLIALILQRACRQQDHQWAQPLTTGFYQVMTDVLHQVNVGMKLVDDKLIDGCKILFDGIVKWQHKLIFYTSGVDGRPR